MWWYRNQEGKESPDAAATPAAKSDLPAPLVEAVRAVLSGRPADPDALLVMSLLVDSRIELEDGSVVEGLDWHRAERFVQEAVAAREPLRLYNRFARDYGDGHTRRPDLPAEHRRVLDDFRAALRAAPGVRSVTP